VKALVYTAPHQVVLETHPDPVPGPDQVVIRVRASGVCGSDLLGFLGKSKKRVPPLILGHEMAGEVARVGAGVRDLAPGSRVAVMPLITCGTCEHCREGRNSVCEKRLLLGMNLAGGFAEYVVAPRSCLYPVPAAMDFLSASMVECVATSSNLFHNHVRRPVRTAAVFGAGTQGILALQLARRAGAREVFSIDVHEARLAVAGRLGGTALHAKKEDPVAAILARTGGRGCDVVVDAAGYSPVRRQALSVTARGGVLALVGLSDAATEFDVGDIINRELEIHGIYGYAPGDYERALEAVAAGTLDVTSWVREFPLEEGQRIMEQLTTAPGDLVKASLSP